MLLTTKLFKADDIIEHSDERLFRAILKSDHCSIELLPLRKNYFGKNLRKNGRGLKLPLAKTERFKSSFVMRCVCFVVILYVCTQSYTCLYYGIMLLLPFSLLSVFITVCDCQAVIKATYLLT